MDTETTSGGGLSRRTVIKRGALVGGAMVWTTPLVQSIGGTAFAATGSVCRGTLTVGDPGQPGCVIIGYVTYGTDCCACVTSLTAPGCTATCLSGATLVPAPPGTSCS